MVRLTTQFCISAEKGGKASLEKLAQLMDKDPKKYIRASSHPENIMNRQNSKEETPLYLAAKNGNFDVVKFLVKRHVDVNLPSKVRILFMFW